MIPSTEREKIVNLIKKEVVPAIGCTEPIAVALCVAKATEVLGSMPTKVNIKLSANVLKNAMGVGIPGTKMVGLPIAVALGVLIGKSEYQLEVLKDVTPESVELAKQFIDKQIISIKQKEDTNEKLYIEVEAMDENNSATAIITQEHTSFIYIKRNNEILLDIDKAKVEVGTKNSIELCLHKVYDFAMTTPIEEIEFILDSRKLNMEAANRSLEGEFGHCVGRTLQNKSNVDGISGGVFFNMLTYTSAACDARMAGAMIPIMSNSGSGNQGIAATLPVVIYARDMKSSEEQTIRALILSHLTVIYIKQSLGRLSALCGCVIAATGSSCGVTYLMGGGYNEVEASVKNMIANLTGMICDGAKPSCSMKLASGVSTAILSALMAMNGQCVSSTEGIIDECVDKCISNITRIGRDGMDETDKIVLQIMTNK